MRKVSRKGALAQRNFHRRKRLALKIKPAYSRANLRKEIYG
jgi:hypothetical protein